jgi:hypothetical protein
LSGDGGEHGFAGCIGELIRLLFAALITEPAVIALGNLTGVRRLLPLSRNFSMPLPRFLGLNWLTKMQQMPFCNRRMVS